MTKEYFIEKNQKNKIFAFCTIIDDYILIKNERNKKNRVDNCRLVKMMDKKLCMQCYTKGTVAKKNIT